ncbi:MAG: DUF1573 domain-containing protein [Planctomycetota bacterium]|nr:DUF1573 domain-containing protein [Planctomycetota bacterium]
MNSTNLKLLALLATVFLWSIRDAASQIQFQKRQIEFWPSYQEGSVIGRFVFANIGDYAVTIKKLETTCNCTTTRLARKTYQPGEIGEIVATVDFENGQGLMLRPVLVHTDDPMRQKISLSIKAQVPLLAEIKPMAVFWKRGEKPIPKSILVNFVPAAPIHLLEVQTKTSAVTTRIKTIEEGRKYEVLIVPTATDAKFQASLDLVTDFSFEERNKVRVYAFVP